MTDQRTSIALTGHVEIGIVDIMIGVTGTVSGRHGGMSIAAAESGKETNVGAKIGAGRPTDRTVGI